MSIVFGTFHPKTTPEELEQAEAIRRGEDGLARGFATLNG